MVRQRAVGEESVSTPVLLARHQKDQSTRRLTLISGPILPAHHRFIFKT